MPSLLGRSLVGKTSGELRDLMKAWDQPAFRGDQLYEAIYRQRTRDFNEIGTLPGPVRERLAAEFDISRPEIASAPRRALSAGFLRRSPAGREHAI